ncbi:MAG TPA: lysylphosphatidylglycerol synthase domain-containing protein [Ramlibacter sp.]|nr:lysylphosphatidylglycerol synthase domain-containing protein [Ramlibacter sp.]
MNTRTRRWGEADEGARAARAPAAKSKGKSTWWPWLKRILTFAFFALVAWYSIRYARNVDWREVWQTIQATPRGVLLSAAGLVACSYAIYCSYDLLGRHYTGHRLAKWKTWQVNFISYAFNLNMGSLVGSIAFRYRLYGRLGLDVPTITRIMTLSILTNWLGYFLLGGAVFAIAPLELPPDWKMGSDGLRWLGVGVLAVGLAYVAGCFFSNQRSVTFRGHELILPPPKMAVIQVVAATTNWAIMGGIIFTLLQGKVDYFSVLSVLLVGAVAGVITHVPAGLGVLEAVFIALLSHRVPEGQLLAALLTYRALYYIGPLLVAAAVYLLVEARAKHTQVPQPHAPNQQ